MEISRARFLTGAAAVAAGLAAPLATARPAAASGSRGLTYRGVVYGVVDGGTPQTSWSAARMRHDIAAIRHRLHANSVLIEGDGVERLAASADEAVERGLHVWLRPTLGDRPAQEILDHLAAVGRHAEHLRRHGAAVHLSVGCEFVLYVPGIVPGTNALERVHNLLTGHYDPVAMARRLHAFTARAAAVGRSVFHGRMTYSAAQDEDVDWRLFDIVGIDYYSYFSRPAAYVRELRTFQRWGKPVAIMEFGTGTFTGAAAKADMAWDVVDYDVDPPRIKGHLVRSEHDQAAYLTSLYDVFDSMGLYAASAFDFVDPDNPHRSDPRYDLDLASYGLVKAIWQSPDAPGRWHWEPKQSFTALARRYAAAALRRSVPGS